MATAEAALEAPSTCTGGREKGDVLHIPAGWIQLERECGTQGTPKPATPVGCLGARVGLVLRDANVLEMWQVAWDVLQDALETQLQQQVRGN